MTEAPRPWTADPKAIRARADVLDWKLSDEDAEMRRYFVQHLDALCEAVANAVRPAAPTREQVEALPRWTDGGFCDGDSGMCGAKMERDSDGDWLRRDAVLALWPTTPTTGATE